MVEFGGILIFLMYPEKLEILGEDPALIDRYYVRKSRGMKDCFRIRRVEIGIVYKALKKERKILIIGIEMERRYGRKL